MKSIIKNQNGFTLIELLIALVIFAVGILGLATMQMSSIKGNSKSRQISETSNIAADRIERFLSLDYDDPLLDDGDGDGTGQDTSTPPNGVDNSGGNFGLDDVTAATADGNFISTDGNYQLFWNIAVDHPLPKPDDNVFSTKTIKFIIVPPGSAKNVEMTYVKTCLDPSQCE